MPKLLDKLRTDLLFDRGVRVAEEGSYQRALTFFEDALELAPDFALAHANVGFCYYKMGKPEEALAAFEQARALAPDDAEHVYDIGCIHHGQGRKEEALECFREALQLQPEYAEAYSAMEQVRIELGLPAYDLRVKVQPELVDFNLPEAEEPVESLPSKPAAAPQRNAAELLQLGEDCYEQGKLEEALEAWDQAAKLDSKNPKAHNNRAAALFGLGRHQEAIDACSVALRIQPDYAIAHMTRGEIYASLGNRDAVMREYTALNQLDEDMARQLLEMIQDAPDTDT